MMCDRESADGRVERLDTSESPNPDPQDDVLCASFNQDFTSLCIGTAKGYQIFDLVKNDELHRLCKNQSVDQASITNCVIVQRLYSSSLVAVVSEDHPRKLSVNHFKKNSHICSYTYLQGILSVLLNRERLVVVCEDRLSIHVVKDMELIHTISDTPSNPSGLCALANSTENCFLAYPGSSTNGVVQIFDAYNLKSVLSINAHNNSIQCMAFSDDGTKLATASDKGTLLRVFAVTPGPKQGHTLFELRRGITRNVKIHCLTFDLDAQFLLASSNTATIHIFHLRSPAPETKADSSYVSGVYSMLSTAVSAGTSYLPSQVAGIMVQERAFATATLPSEGHTTKVALTNINKVPRVVVATADGMVYIYDFNPQQGGVCNLIRQHNLSPRAPLEVSLSEGEGSSDALGGGSHLPALGGAAPADSSTDEVSLGKSTHVTSDLDPSPVAISSSKIPGSVWLNLGLQFTPENSRNSFWIHKSSKDDDLHRQALREYEREASSKEVLADAVVDKSWQVVELEEFKAPVIVQAPTLDDKNL